MAVNKNKDVGAVLWVLLVGIALVSLGLLPWLFYFGPLSARHSQSEWPTVPGRIVSSELVEFGAGSIDGPGYYWEVRFAYDVAGTNYTAEQDWPGREGPPGASGPRASVTVYYNPADPSRAVIRPGVISSWGPILTGLGFLVGGLGAVALFSGIWILTPDRAKTIFRRGPRGQSF